MAKDEDCDALVVPPHRFRELLFEVKCDELKMSTKGCLVVESVVRANGCFLAQVPGLGLKPVDGKIYYRDGKACFEVRDEISDQADWLEVPALASGIHRAIEAYEGFVLKSTEERRSELKRNGKLAKHLRVLKAIAQVQRTGSTIDIVDEQGERFTLPAIDANKLVVADGASITDTAIDEDIFHLSWENSELFIRTSPLDRVYLCNVCITELGKLLAEHRGFRVKGTARNIDGKWRMEDVEVLPPAEALLAADW